MARTSRSSFLGVGNAQRSQPRRGRRFATIFILLALTVLITVIHRRADNRDRMDPVTSIVRTVTVPFVSGVSGVWEWLSGQIGWIFRGRAVDAENQRLIRENERLQEEVNRLREADITATRLRAQLNFAESTPKKVAAGITSLRPLGSDTLVITRGSRDGVRKYSVVAAPTGVVGFVYDLAPTSSGVLLTTSLQSSIGCRIQRADSRAIGVCKGTGKGTMTLVYLSPEANVKPGDVVITSGLGGELGVFPAGLALGKVESVSRPGSGSARSVTVRPSVDVTRLEEVFLLK